MNHVAILLYLTPRRTTCGQRHGHGHGHAPTPGPSMLLPRSFLVLTSIHATPALHSCRREVATTAALASDSSSPLASEVDVHAYLDSIEDLIRREGPVMTKRLSDPKYVVPPRGPPSSSLSPFHLACRDTLSPRSTQLTTPQPPSHPPTPSFSHP